MLFSEAQHVFSETLPFALCGNKGELRKGISQSSHLSCDFLTELTHIICVPRKTVDILILQDCPDVMDDTLPCLQTGSLA